MYGRECFFRRLLAYVSSYGEVDVYGALAGVNAPFHDADGIGTDAFLFGDAGFYPSLVCRCFRRYSELIFVYHLLRFIICTSLPTIRGCPAAIWQTMP